jgi:hypothetical protein
VRAEVLGREANSNPVFTRARYGNGRAYFLSVPIELDLANRAGGFHNPSAALPWWQIYRTISEPFVAQRAVHKADPFIGLTEHPLGDGRRVVIAINYSPEPREVGLEITEPWTAAEAWYGAAPAKSSHGWQIRLASNDAAVFTATKR